MEKSNEEERLLNNNENNNLQNRISKIIIGDSFVEDEGEDVLSEDDISLLKKKERGSLNILETEREWNK